jgi:alkaline phosphatase
VPDSVSNVLEAMNMKGEFMSRPIRYLLALLCGITVLVGLESANADDSVPKNIILMIGDGCGFNHIEATDYFKYGDKGQQVFEKDFRHLAVSTYPEGGGYDAQAAWGDFQYVKKGATDSAAAATAMATGRKTRNGMLGVDPEKNPMENLVEKAEKLGKATGVVTTVQFSHATPACFVAHNRSRGNYAEIAQEMLLKSGLEVVMGAGHPWFSNDGQKTVTQDGNSLPEGLPEQKYRYVGGSDLWRQLLSGTAASDCDGDGQPDPWSLVQSRDEFKKLGEGDTPKRVAGVAQAEATLQQRRTSAIGKVEDETPGQTPLLENMPTLTEMTRAAINVLDNDPDGFFLMIEGGAIDWASDDELGRTIEEVMDFSSAIEAVVSWVEAKSNWRETMVIVTADHETGYLNGPGSDPDWKPIQNNGKGNMPGVKRYAGHTNSLVPLFVKGPGAEAFEKAAVHEDPKRGEYLDNTDIGKVLAGLLAK